MIIYKATNKLNGKFYIGKTIKSLDVRKRNHLAKVKRKNDRKQTFHKAILKYGSDNFEWKILEKCKSKRVLAKQELHWLQVFYGDDYSGLGRIGYNMVALSGGGDTFNNHPDKELIRNNQIGKNNSFYGRRHTKETKEKIGKYLSENRQGKNHPLYGKKFKKKKHLIRHNTAHHCWDHNIDIKKIIDLYFNGITTIIIAKELNVESKAIVRRYKLLGLFVLKSNSQKEVKKKNRFIEVNKSNKLKFILLAKAKGAA